MSEMDHGLYPSPNNFEPYTQADLDAARIAEIDAMPCEMYHEPPFDFAYCERHDTTFALGDVCKYQKINQAKDQP